MPGSISTAPTRGGSSPLGAGTNLVNTIIGSGILALPYALREAGFYSGIITLLLAAVLIYLALNMLVLAGRRTGLYRFEAVSEAALGRPGYHILGFALAVNSIGSCISYLIIIGDTVTSIAQTAFGINAFTSRVAVILLASVVFTLPLLFFRTLDPLVKPSAVSTLCFPIIVAIVAIRGPTYALPEPAPTPFWGPSFLPAFGVIAFAYSCTQTCFQSYTTLQTKTMDAWRIATRFATTTAVLVYLAFSIVSYKSFGLLTDPNVLNNFSADDTLANVARALLAFSLTLTYPMQFYPIRDLLGYSFLGISPEANQPAQQRMRFHAFTVLLFASTVTVAVIVNDLGFVFKLIGTGASSLLIFVLPGIIYLSLISPYSWLTKNSNDQIAFQNSPAAEASPLLPPPSADPTDPLNDARSIREPLLSVVAVLLLVIGCAVFVIGTWDSIADYVKS
ncbi:hypothetical protein IW140_003860 [Coemansia sp. RSA 1813]|nr:hypothetical protein EV178_004097 [Coemansia sp. RSA 1646]KAJ1770699.1 hypothetical protein LPJ74_002989 [Coemansia sp. RSA 1843]KAJ2087349.1 hypothetical protein IW138_005055 [Coemansia sp. RSA 986]KAJ2215687.1 hypothetical protein EV179_001911 [Coemansia sp. RSA 487]KAJ2568432.1 hypothetical protein IW140_003860 [Coemansia sp. RSA 1813]